MSSSHVPPGMRTVNPYLTVSDAGRLMDFVIEAFGAEVLDRHARPDGRMAHGAVRIGDSTIEMSDASGEWGPFPCALHVYVENCDATHERALGAGGVSLFEPMDMPYGERGSAVKDPVGNNWYIATYTGVFAGEAASEG